MFGALIFVTACLLLAGVGCLLLAVWLCRSQADVRNLAARLADALQRADRDAEMACQYRNAWLGLTAGAHFTRWEQELGRLSDE